MRKHTVTNSINRVGRGIGRFFSRFVDSAFFKSFKLRKSRLNMVQLLFLLFVGFALVSTAVLYPHIKTQLEEWADELHEKKVREEHTADPVLVAPTTTGLLFNIEIAVSSDSVFTTYWLKSDILEIRDLAKDTDKENVDGKHVRPLKLVSNSSYSRDVVNMYRARISALSQGDVMNPLAPKLWTNNQFDKPGGDEWKEEQLTITAIITYYSPAGAQGEQYKIHLTLPVWYYQPSPDWIGGDFSNKKVWTYSDTYVYVPWTNNPRYSLVTLEIDGHYKYHSYTQSFSSWKDKDQRENTESDPVTYYYPVKYPVDAGNSHLP